MYPGIYQIVCKQNKKIYIGESDNCLYRIGGHFSALKNNTHHCLPLLQDFKKYGSQNFSAYIIKSGDNYKNFLIRKKEEKLLILKIPLNFCYNSIIELKKNESPCYKAYKYKGKIFHTIKDLRFFINKESTKKYSETHFRRYFISSEGKFSHLISFIKKRPQTDIFKINNKIFYGWREVVNAHLAKNKRQVFYRLNSSKWITYQYYKKTKKRIGFNRHNKSYIINNIYYSNAQEIVEAGLAKDINQVYYRIRSSSKLWKNWCSKIRNA